jgi:flagellar motor switch protein FliM
VSTNVEPEEAEAIRAILEIESEQEEARSSIEQRDFRRPRRFSGSALEGLRLRLAMRLPELDRALRSVLKVSVRTEVAALFETSAEGIFDGFEAPFAVAGFETGGQPGWISWDIRAAVRAIEQLLGSEGEPEPRALSSIENRLLAMILGAVVDAVTRGLSVEASNLRVEVAKEDIKGWRDAGEGAEPHRLCVAVRLEGPYEPSTFHVYLPGFGESGVGSRRADTLELPPHAHRVQVELGAFLGSADVPLDHLLSLELGDVIPLGTTLSDPVVLRVEGRPCGTAEMGTHKGNRAVRILDVRSILDELS